MSLRVHTIITHLSPDEAMTLIDFLDQVRDVLLETYGGEIRAVLQEASTTMAPRSAEGDDDPF